MNYSNIAYAKVNLGYDREIFAKEYDKFILPNTRPISNSLKVVEQTASLNTVWQMVSDDKYKNIVTNTVDENGNFVSLTEGRSTTWKMAQLMYVKPEGIDEKILKATNNGYDGGTLLRNSGYEREWLYKPEYEHLRIVKFIKNLPFKRVVFIHCVSLEPGEFAGIHRDNRGHTNEGNEIAKNGYVVLTLNISDGGVPLYWSLDGEQRLEPNMANDAAYIISDYFLHGVPVTTSRRRQIRVTGIPTDEFASLIETNTIVSVSDDYHYQPNLI